jgi:hypothetical protein
VLLLPTAGEIQQFPVNFVVLPRKIDPMADGLVSTVQNRIGNPTAWFRQ